MAEFTFAPLTPAGFLARSASAFADRTAIVDGDLRLTYAEFADRCALLVSALAGAGIDSGSRVAAICSNSHVMLELHHAVPARGAVLVPINTRLSSTEIRYILEHSGAGLVVATHEFASLAHDSADALGIRLVIAGDDGDEYEQLLSDVIHNSDDVVEVGEADLLAINYTSGTTGRPKGVMYHHRGAYLQALAMAYHGSLQPDSGYLWTLPMFHCNGWCFTWAVTAAGATHVCLRSLDVGEAWRLLRTEKVTNLSAAPTVLTMLAEGADSAMGRRIHVDTGGAPPSPSLLERLKPLGFDVTHLYGLTETFGPVAVNQWQDAWDELPLAQASRLRARQGIGNIISRPLRILDVQGADVPADGRTIGEIAIAGNNVMSGYYRDEPATVAASRSGCLLTGDLGVMHPDGYVEIRDRGKDIIISGGENIASIEVEQALDSHPDVLESAVVGRSDPHWGEVPVAFVSLRQGSQITSDQLADHVRGRLARFKVPKSFEFVELPKTSTGKIQKNVLRDRLAET